MSEYGANACGVIISVGVLIMFSCFVVSSIINAVKKSIQEKGSQKT